MSSSRPEDRNTTELIEREKAAQAEKEVAYVRCETCSYWAQYTKSQCVEAEVELGRGLMQLGQCHHSPPQLIPMDGKYSIAVPETEHDQWCGQWHEKGKLLPNGSLPPTQVPEDPDFPPPNKVELI